MRAGGCGGTRGKAARAEKTKGMKKMSQSFILGKRKCGKGNEIIIRY